MGTEATDLPKLGAPARRALIGAGYTRLEQHLRPSQPTDLVQVCLTRGPSTLRTAFSPSQGAPSGTRPSPGFITGKRAWSFDPTIRLGLAITPDECQSTTPALRGRKGKPQTAEVTRGQGPLDGHPHSLPSLACQGADTESPA
jgi:hypothetical protein